MIVDVHAVVGARRTTGIADRHVAAGPPDLVKLLREIDADLVVVHPTHTDLAVIKGAARSVAQAQPAMPRCAASEPPTITRARRPS